MFESHNFSFVYFLRSSVKRSGSYEWVTFPKTFGQQIGVQEKTDRSVITSNH